MKIFGIFKKAAATIKSKHDSPKNVADNKNTDNTQADSVSGSYGKAQIQGISEETEIKKLTSEFINNLKNKYYIEDEKIKEYTSFLNGKVEDIKKQINFIHTLLKSSFTHYDGDTKVFDAIKNVDNKEIQDNQIDFATNLIEEHSFRFKDAESFTVLLENTKTKDDTELNLKKINYINNLINKNIKMDDIVNISYGLRGDNSEVVDEIIKFSNSILENNNQEEFSKYAILFEELNADTIEDTKELMSIMDTLIAKIKKVKAKKNQTDTSTDNNISCEANDFNNIKATLKNLKEDNKIDKKQLETLNYLLDKNMELSIIPTILAGCYSKNPDTKEAQNNFLHELVEKYNLKGSDLSLLIRYTNTNYDDNDNTRIEQRTRTTIKKLLDTGVKTSIFSIVYSTNLHNETSNKMQTDFLYDLIDNYHTSNDLLWRFLNSTNIQDKKAQVRQISFAKELIESKFETDEINDILLNTKLDDDRSNENTINFAKSLIKKNFSKDKICALLKSTTVTDNNSEPKYFPDSQAKQIDFAEELLSSEYDFDFICELLNSTKNIDSNIEEYLIETAQDFLTSNKEIKKENIPVIIKSLETKNIYIAKDKNTLLHRLLDIGYSESNAASITEEVHKKENIEDLIKFSEKIMANETLSKKDKCTIIKSVPVNRKSDFFRKVIQDIEDMIDEGYDAKSISSFGYRAENFCCDSYGGCDFGLLETMLDFTKEVANNKNLAEEEKEFICSYTPFGCTKIALPAQLKLLKTLIDKGYSIKNNYNNIEKIIIVNGNFSMQQATQINVASSIIKNGFSLEVAKKANDIIFKKYVGEDFALNIEKLLSSIKFDEENLYKTIDILCEISKESDSKIDIDGFIELIKELGFDEVNKLTTDKIIILSNFSVLKNVKDVNSIPIENKRNILRKFIKLNSSIFEASKQVKNLYPLLPTSQEEYCELIPALVKSIGIDTKPLNEEEIQNFNVSINSLSNSLKNISDVDFNKLSIKLKYPKEEFIKDVFEQIKDLPQEEKQKVFDYYGFELKKNSATKTIKNVNGVEKEIPVINSIDGTDETRFSIIGYPVNLNNGKKLAKVEDEKTKEVIEKIRPLVIKFSEKNEIALNNDNKTMEKDLNEIIKILPEFITTIDKKQHNTHSFDVAKHSLKVMQKIAQNPSFNKLNDSDKKIMLMMSLLHDISKQEGVNDSFHATNGAFDTFYIAQKFKLNRNEQIKLYTLIKNHEWLGYVNNPTVKNKEERDKRQKSVAFDLQYDNLFELSKIFTQADLKAVKNSDIFYETSKGNKRLDPITNTQRSFKDALKMHSDAIEKDILELKKTQPLLPVTKIPKASTIDSAITVVNPDGSTNIKGVYKNKDGLIIIKFNEVEDWNKIGFSKNATSSGILTKDVNNKTINTGNIKFFVHGLDNKDQLRNFDAFALPDSDALLSVSYAERPESKYRFFRTQGILLNTDSQYVYGGGNSDSGSGFKKTIDRFKNEYIFGGHREEDRKYISDVIKKALNLNDEEYLDFVKRNKNKSFDEIKPKEITQKLIMTFAKINSTPRRDGRCYNEMYLSNPNVMATFAYPTDEDKIPDVLNFVEEQPEFIRNYSLENDIPMVIFGD